MREAPRGLFLRYGVALALVAGVALVVERLLPAAASAAFLLYTTAVLLSAWYGGFGPAVLATSLATLAYVLQMRQPDAHDWLRLGLFVFLSCLQSWLIAALYAAQRRAEALARERRQSEERVRHVLESAHEGIWMIDADGRTTFINPPMARLLGRTPEEIRGQPWWDFLSPDSRKEALHYWDRRRPGGREQHDLCFRKSDGTDLWALVSLNPIYEHGVCTGALAMITDITQRKRTDEAMRFIVDATQILASSLDYESTLRSVARLAVPGMADWCTVDIREEDGTVRRLAAIHADPQKESLAWELWRSYPPDPRDAIGLMNVLRTGRAELYPEITDGQLRAQARDDEHLRMLHDLGVRSEMIVPLRARGRTLGAITFVAAGSGRRYAPADLSLAETLARRATLAVDNALLYGEAQKEIAERRQVERHLNQVSAELRKANQAKDEFLAMLAHELRNPLAPLLNALHLLKNAETDPDQSARTREMAERQVRHMARLVDDLLDVSRITRGKITLAKERIDLRTVLERARDGCQTLVESRKHTLTVTLPDRPLPLDADPTRLEQVFANLLNNAAKYTEPGGRIELSAGVQGEEAVVRVKDNGVGIPPDVLPHVFDLFVQADRSLDRSQGGLGIGLTLVRSLVALHGGSVDVQSEGPGKGSEFLVRLPLAKGTVPAPPERGPAGPQANGQALRVLVVDDNKDAAQSMALLLQLHGHDVRLAHDGPSAIDLARDFRPDVVFLDIGLPKMDGYQVARRLRQEAGLRSATLVAVTGYGQEDDRRRSQEAGFDHHVVKPVDPAKLEELLTPASSQ